MNSSDVLFDLVDTKASLIAAWEDHFSDVEQVTARCGSILETRADAIVSPANSFGFMDGGLDLALSMHFGWEPEKNVRRVLANEYDGELPVGQAIIVPTDHPQVPWLVSAPTMRVPMRVDQTANAYLAFRGILRAVRDHNATHPEEARIRRVACPGLGTGTGKMPSERCARQMRYAWRACVEGEPVLKGGLAGAVRHHMSLIDYEMD